MHELITYAGCLICAKTAKGIAGISRQFAAHTINKQYIAILIGNVTTNSITICENVAGDFISLL